MDKPVYQPCRDIAFLGIHIAVCAQWQCDVMSIIFYSSARHTEFLIKLDVDFVAREKKKRLKGIDRIGREANK